MKKHLSVFVFMSRYMLWPTLLVSVLGAAATFWRLHSALDEAIAGFGGFGGGFFDAAGIVVKTGVTLLAVLLMLPMRERSGVQPGYTLRRLRVSERTAFLWQGAAAGMALFIFLMVQGAVCLFYGLWLQNNGYGSAGNMSLLVAMVTSTPTHARFPLGDWPVYIRMAAVLFTLGCSTAYSGFISRRGKLALSPFVLLALAWFTDAVFAPVGEYTYEALIAAVCAISLACMLISIHSREQDDDGVSDYDAAGGEQLGQN